MAKVACRNLMQRLAATFVISVAAILLAEIIDFLNHSILHLPPLMAIVYLGIVVAVACCVWRRPAAAALATLATTLIASCTFLWIARNVDASLHIRAATASDRVREKYFGLHESTAGQQITEIRNIVVASGIFTLDSSIGIRLVQVKNGVIKDVNGVGVGRTPNNVPRVLWQLHVDIALGTSQTDRGRLTHVGCAGHKRGSGAGIDRINDVKPERRTTVECQLNSGQRQIVYVEGAQDSTLHDRMTVEDFARVNRGNYLVVEIEFQ